MSTNQTYWNELLDILIERFAAAELDHLAFRLGIEELSETIKAKKATELMQIIKQQDKILDLIKISQKIRPDIHWPIPPWLIDEAQRLERNRAYEDAIKLWQEISELQTDNTFSVQQIQRLEIKQAQQTHLAELKKQLSKRKLEIKPIYRAVASRLKQMEKTKQDETEQDEDEAIIELVEEFLAAKLAAEDFIKLWLGQADQLPPTETLEAPNYSALADRLQRGDIVILLGSEIPPLFDQNQPHVEELTPKLAQCVGYTDFSGSFPEICEYMHLDHQFGRNSLCLELQKLLDPSPSTLTAAYEFLAKVKKPLLLISATYDSFLENTFRQHQKRFVLLCHSNEETGNLFLEYSDRTEIEFCSTETLSSLQLLEQDYSVIYKVLGRFNHQENTSDCLMLSERDYLTFAQSKGKLIPNYIINQLRNRGFWLLGYYPNSWENRLIIREILDKRRHQEAALTVQPQADKFARLYWADRRVRNYPVALTEFISNLQKYL